MVVHQAVKPAILVVPLLQVDLGEDRAAGCPGDEIHHVRDGISVRDGDGVEAAVVAAGPPGPVRLSDQVQGRRPRARGASYHAGRLKGGELLLGRRQLLCVQPPEGGQGCILCPVCIMEVRQDGKPYPVYLGRHAYMQHWERFHYSSQVATYSFSATQLHTRLYMGQSIYTLVLANRNRGKDDITGMSVSVDVMRGLGVTDYDMGIMTLFPPEDKKKDVEVVDLREAMEDTEPPSASEDCGGGDALEAINRWAMVNTVQSLNFSLMVC